MTPTSTCKKSSMNHSNVAHGVVRCGGVVTSLDRVLKMLLVMFVFLLVVLYCTVVKAIYLYNTKLLPPNTTMIVIVERSGRELHNYPVRIILDASNFPHWNEVTCNSVWNPSSCNFWFTDIDGNPLYYWVEYFNASEKRAIIWVKVPYIPAGRATAILMHWNSTNPYSSYLSVSHVFRLFASPYWYVLFRGSNLKYCFPANLGEMNSLYYFWNPAAAVLKYVTVSRGMPHPMDWAGGDLFSYMGGPILVIPKTTPLTLQFTICSDDAGDVLFYYPFTSITRSNASFGFYGGRGFSCWPSYTITIKHPIWFIYRAEECHGGTSVGVKINGTYITSAYDTAYYTLYTYDIAVPEPEAYVVSNVTLLGLAEWTLWNTAENKAIVWWGVTGIFLDFATARKFWYVTEAGGGYQPLGAFGIKLINATVDDRSFLDIGVYAFVANVTLVKLSTNKIELLAERNIARILSYVSSGIITSPYSDWLRQNNTVIALVLPVGLIPTDIKYSLDGSTWTDVSTDRVGKILDVANLTLGGVAWYFDPSRGLFIIRLPLNQSTGRVWLRITLGTESASASVAPSTTSLYIGDYLTVKVTLSSTSITKIPLLVTVACYGNGQLAFMNRTLLNYPTGQTSTTIRLMALAPPGTYVCYVWVEDAEVGSFKLTVKTYTTTLYWTQPTGQFTGEAGDAVLFHIYDLYFTGKNRYSNVTIHLNKSFTVHWGYYGKWYATYITWNVIPMNLTQGTYMLGCNWGISPCISNLLTLGFKMAIGWDYISTRNYYQVYLLWFRHEGNQHLVDIALRYIKVLEGWGVSFKVFALGKENSVVYGGKDIAYAYIKQVGTNRWFDEYRAGQALERTFLGFLSPGFTTSIGLLGDWHNWRGIAYVGYIGGVGVLRGFYTTLELEAITKYHVIPWKSIVFILDPTFYLWTNRTIVLFSARDYGGYAVVGSEVYVLPSAMYFAYIFKHYASDGYLHLLIPPGMCIRVWNETWSMTFCNLQNELPFMDVPISPGTYHWALGEALPIDIAFVPDSLLSGAAAANIRQSISLLYSDVAVGAPPNTTIKDKVVLSFIAYAWGKATSLLIDTPVPDLVKVEKITVIAWFRLAPKLVVREDEVPIIIVERSGKTLTNYPIKIELTAENFHAWSSLSCNSVWNPTSCNFWFTDARGDPLYYWVMYFNASEKKAIIYVKVPLLPANGTTVIIMHWGSTNPYTSYLSPTHVAIFFSNFNSLDKWHYTSSYVHLLSNGWVQIYKPNSNFYYGGYAPIVSVDTVPNVDVLVIVRWKFYSNNGPNEGVDVGVPFSSPQSDCIYTSTPIYYVLFAPESENHYRIWVHRESWHNVYEKSFPMPVNQTIVSFNYVYTYGNAHFARGIVYSDDLASVLLDTGPVKIDPYSGDSGHLAFREFNGEIDFVAVLPYIYPPPLVVVNGTFAELDIGFTDTASPGSTSPRVVAAVRGGSLENATYLVLGSVWSRVASPIVFNSWCRLNLTWILPATQGNVYLTVTCGAYSVSLSGTYMMGGSGLYLWVGAGSSLARANVTIANVTLIYLDTIGNSYVFRLYLSSLEAGVWGTGGGQVKTLRAVMFPYMTSIVLIGNASDYQVVYKISQIFQTTASELSLRPTAFAYVGTDKGVWTFSPELLFKVTPGFAWLKDVKVVGEVYRENTLTVRVPSGASGLFILFKAGGLVRLLVSGSVEKGGSIEAYLFKKGTMESVTVKPNKWVDVDYFYTPDVAGLYIRWRDATVTQVEVRASTLTPLALPPQVGYNSSLVIYVPAFIAIVNLTKGEIADAYQVHTLVIELRDPSTGEVEATYKFANINLLISPVPPMVIFGINGTLFLDLTALSGIAFDSIPIKLSPSTPINIYVTIDRQHWSSWQQPLYLALIYSTGTFRTVVGTAYGFGAVTASSNLIYVRFTLDVPTYLIGDYGVLVLESIKTGLVETFAPFKIEDNQYVTVTKTLETVLPSIGAPAPPHPGKLPITTVPHLPEEVIAQLTTPKAIWSLTFTDQSILAVTVIMAVFALVVSRRIDIMKATLTAGIFLILIGVPLSIFTGGVMWVLIFAGVVMMALALALALWKRV